MTEEELQRLPAATPWESYNWLNRPYNEIIVRFTDDVSDDDLAAKVVEVRRRLRPEAASPSLARRPRGGESDYKRHVALHRLWCDFCTAHPELDPESDTTRDVFISAIRRRKIDASTVWPAHEGEPKVPAWTAARDMLDAAHGWLDPTPGVTREALVQQILETLDRSLERTGRRPVHDSTLKRLKDLGRDD
jgi:hypothetical protein